MPNAYTAQAAVYLINALFGIYMLLVLLRFLLQLSRADFYNPISQFLVKMTSPVIRPLRRIIPGLGGIDLASVVLLVALQMLALVLTFLAVGRSIAFPALTVLTIAELLTLVVNCYMIAIFIQIILSWVGPGTVNPLTSLLYSLTEPIMRPARRLIPPMHGFDLSPIPVILGLQLIKILVIAPIADMGRGLF